MKAKPVVLRARAAADVDEAIRSLLAEAGPAAAGGFVDALERAIGHLERHSRTGSPRIGHELGIPGLRAWALARHPYAIFYVDLARRVDVWRVLHARRDLPAWLTEPDAPEAP